jgi:hypothetical protein
MISLGSPDKCHIDLAEGLTFKKEEVLYLIHQINEAELTRKEKAVASQMSPSERFTELLEARARNRRGPSAPRRERVGGSAAARRGPAAGALQRRAGTMRARRGRAGAGGWAWWQAGAGRQCRATAPAGAEPGLAGTLKGR